jgi:hypothetical protein
MKHASLLLLLSLSVACGGSSSPAASPSSTTSSDAKPTEGAEHKEGHHGHGHEGKDHHPNLAPPVKEFHGVLAPVWHTQAGAARVEKACSNAKTLAEKAQATGDAELIAAAGALEPACAKDGRPEVEAKLAVVHDRFHALAKAEKHD